MRSTRPSNTLALPFLFTAALGVACHNGGGSSSAASSLHPTVRGLACYYDVDRDGRAGAGDELVLGFTKEIRLGNDEASAFKLPVFDNRFGDGAFLREGPGAGDITIVLGTNPRLRTRGLYDAAEHLAGFPSGIDVRSAMAPDAIENRSTGHDARPSQPVDIVPAFVAGASVGAEGLVASASGDLDGDGDLDLLLAYESNFELALGDGHGGFTTSAGASDLDPVQSLALGDLDGDGDLDVVLGTSGWNVVYASNGANPPAFALQQAMLGEDFTHAVALADFDLDGDLDLVAGNAGSDRVYRNDGRGMMIDTGQNLGSSLTLGLATGDFDRDGDQDLVTAGPGTTRVYLNDGTGLVAAGFALGEHATQSIAAGDVDLDGDLDLLAGGETDSLLYLGDGNGAFELSDSSFGEGSTRGLLLIDLDSDARLDLVQARGNEARMWSNDRNGHFVLIGPSIGQAPASMLAPGDFDGDGDLDVFVAESGAPGRLWHSSLTGTWGELGFEDSDQMLVAESTFPLALGDIDADGDLDFATGDLSVLEIWRNGGEGRFDTAPARLPFSEARMPALEFSDLDRDGDLDLVTAILGHGVVLWKNDGEGNFTQFGEPLGTITDPRSLALGDLDGNGSPDLVVGSLYERSDELFLNLGDSGGTWDGFGQPAALGEAYQTNALEMADFNGDGALDLSAGHGSGQADHIFLGNGLGGFEAPAALEVQRSTLSLAIGDIDADGDLDLVAGDDSGERIYTNDGHGTFGLAAELAGTDTFVVRLFDLNGDAALDLLVGNSALQGLEAWTNDGDGSFGSAPFLALEPHSIFSLEAGDLDSDGDLDLLSGNIDGTANQLWWNR